jgi:hypothetical protein
MGTVLEPKLHPVGTRVLVNLNHHDGLDTTIYEVVVREWSYQGYVKLVFSNSEDAEDWGSWHRPDEIHILEVLSIGEGKGS